MESFKGLLSATIENQRIFDRILDDLRSPCEAVLRIIGLRRKGLAYAY